MGGAGGRQCQTGTKVLRGLLSKNDDRLPGGGPRPAAIKSFGASLAICCGLAFAAYVGSYLRIPVVPLFASSLGASTAEVGAINGAFFLMAGILSFPLGLLSDRYGRKLLVVTGLALSAATSWLLCISRTPGQLVWVYLGFGVGVAAIGPTLMSYVADISPASHLGRSYGWYTLSLYSAMTLGPALGGFMAKAWGYRPLFLVTGIFLFLLIWPAIFLLPASPAKSRSPQHLVKTWEGFLELAHNRPLWGCWLATLGGCFGMGLFITFSPLQAQSKGLGLNQIGLIFAVQAVCNALSRLPCGRLSDRLASRSRLATVGLTSLAVSVIALGMSQTLTHFLLAAGALGLSMGLAFTPIGALTAEAAPAETRGLAMGGYNTCIYLGMTLCSAIMGGVIPWQGFGRAALLTALIILGVAVLFSRLLREFSPPLPEE